MSHGTDIFVVGGNEEVLNSLRAKYPGALVQVLKKCVWFQLSSSGHQPSATLLMELSRGCEIIWICMSSPTDYFEYAHWKDSVMLRQLLNENSYFSVAQGEPEEWERFAFFPEDALMEYPTYSRLHGDANRDRVEATSIAVQGEYASICSKDSLHAVISHFGLLIE